ncbi:MAG: ATP-dependent helicase HrpB [Rubricoccaceae bacterium]
MSAALPVEAALPALRAALAAHPSAVLVAPPGAGKTTRVPLALLEAASATPSATPSAAPWLGAGRIVLLEPRRLAARAAARHMAAALGERVGETVGLRVRGETRISARTRLEVVTEGVLTRLLHADAALEGVGLVVFDEFHERSLHADLGLALALDVQETLRPELRLLVMSATLDGARVAALLGREGRAAPVVQSEGRAFPVETRYLGRPARRDAARYDVAEGVAAAVLGALARDEGSVLAFLPGQAEIRRAAARLEGALPPDVALAPLYGDLPAAAQDRAAAPAPPGTRKVVLATAIAETSLTIEGVRIVVDGGLARRPRFSPRSGMTRLETVRVSRAAAAQRRGRAGRTAPGVCYRLWSEAEHAALEPFDAPEIASADLAPLALDLAVWGARPEALRWLDAPPEAALAQARDLLGALGALGADGRPTAHGRALAALPLHPRLGHLLLEGHARGLGALAADVAALLSERDVLRAPHPDAHDPDAHDPDFRLRLDALRPGAASVAGMPVAGMTVDRAARERVRAEAARLRAELEAAPAGLLTPTGGSEGPPASKAASEAAGVLLALAYPERVAQRQAETAAGVRYRLRSGRSALVPAASPLAGAPFLALGDVDERPGGARVFLAAPLAAEEVESLFGTDVQTEDEVGWDAAAGAVRARRRTTLGALVLREAPLADPAPAAMAEALMAGLRAAGPAALGWSREAARLRQRLAFMHHHAGPPWPDVSDDALMASLEVWLGPYLAGLRRLADVQRIDLGARLLDTVPWPERAELDRLAPGHLVVPSGSRLPLDYADPEAPVLAVRLQEVFGLERTPAVLGGRVPVVLHLLSPAGRPVQVTRDLASFWDAGYFDVRKDLRGRYPRHPWPDDPRAAPPTARARRRGE